jgi:carbon-monoxide dehydrogenase small subunit
MKQLILLGVNGTKNEVDVVASKTLLEVLREDLRLTGTKCACDDSSCGACTVLVNGTPMLSCVMLAASYQDAEITTIEGLGTPEEMHPLQEGYCVEGGAQCGFCTPGVIMSAKALLDRNPDPSREEIAQALSGNLCRCTGYEQMYQSITHAVKKLQKPAAAGR